MIRPVSGGCWGEACFLRLRTQGDFQWHGYPDPVSVETCSCARTYSHCGNSGPCTKQIVNLQCGASRHTARNAVCRRSLPCVRRVDGGYNAAVLWPERGRDRPLKPGLQKRLKKRTDCGGNHLGCPHGAEAGIAVRTKWQSGSASGDGCAAALKGEPPPSATRGVPWGKPDPYLSRKIYLVRCR